MTLYSKQGEAFGEGNYTHGETVNFGLESPIIEISEGKRLVFTGWQSNQEYGYTGSDYTNNVKMLENIREIASWKTQYYLNTSSELSKFVYPKSGWYDEGKVLGIYTEPPSGTEFISWIGSGNNSYSGDDFYQSIKLTSPLREQAVFARENYSLTITSEYGDIWGGGVFPAWENTSFGIEDKYVYIDSGVRWVFIGWNSDSIYGYNGKNSDYTIELVGDISQVADWEKQYYVNISTTPGGNVTVESGWVSDYTEVHLNCTTQDGYIFTGWTGMGDSPYSSEEINQSILVTSPINVTAHWKKKFIVQIESELDADGSGVYLDGDLVKLEALETDGLIVRRVFKEWSGDISSSNNPFVFNISRDIEVSTVYEKNYTVFLGILGTIIVLVGLFFYRFIKK